jgi:hypothetical protein
VRLIVQEAKRRKANLRPVDFVPKWKRSSNAKHALDYLCVEAPFWAGVILILEGSLIRGAAVLLCWVVFFVLMLRRELKMQLITDRPERGSFHAQTAFLGALLVLIFPPAYLHERWIVVTFAAALMIAGLITVIAGLVLLRRTMSRI